MSDERVCAGCGHANQPHYKFCLGCGQNLREQAAVPPTSAERVCPSCSTRAPAHYKFCLTCGETLIAEGPAPKPRQVIPPPIRSPRRLSRSWLVSHGVKLLTVWILGAAIALFGLTGAAIFAVVAVVQPVFALASAVSLVLMLVGVGVVGFGLLVRLPRVATAMSGRVTRGSVVARSMDSHIKRNDVMRKNITLAYTDQHDEQHTITESFYDYSVYEKLTKGERETMIYDVLRPEVAVVPRLAGLQFLPAPAETDVRPQKVEPDTPRPLDEPWQVPLSRTVVGDRVISILRFTTRTLEVGRLELSDGRLRHLDPLGRQLGAVQLNERFGIERSVSLGPGPLAQLTVRLAQGTEEVEVAVVLSQSQLSAGLPIREADPPKLSESAFRTLWGHVLYTAQALSVPVE